MSLTLEIADRIASRTLAAGGEKGFLPLCVVVLDAGGCPLVLKRDERASIGRPEIARGKAAGCLSLGFGGRELQRRAQTMTAFMTAAAAILPHGIVPVPGGVLIRDASGKILGAVGVSGEASDNDEWCAVAGIEDAGLVADTGNPKAS